MVKAREIKEYPEPMREDATLHGQPGDMVRVYNNGRLLGFDIACPKCGLFAVIPTLFTEKVHWTPASGKTKVGTEVVDYGPGDLNDVTTLSLSPSMLRGCCGWHGFLIHGIFKEC